MKLILFILFFLTGLQFIHAQQEVTPVDSAVVKKSKKSKANKIDTSLTINHPKIAATRSAIIPGWGQIYNKKIWKVPIIYAGLGITAGVFVYNINTYKDLKVAYSGKYNARVFHDSTDYYKIPPELMPLSEESLRYNRDQYRKYADYAAVIFLIIWGLNVVDASVDAHLRSFDVSPDLSLKVKPGYSDMAGTNGLSLVFTIGK